MNFKVLKIALATAVGLWLVNTSSAQRAEDKTVNPQRTFTSPAQARDELLKAATAHNMMAVHEIFGPEVTNLMTGDKALDEKHFDEFVADVTENCKMVSDGDSRMTMEIGKDEWAFPVPLVQTNGAWIFDTIAGEEEIINRHIGRDEFYAIGVCRGYVKAQQKYSALFPGPHGSPQYAQKFKSSAGKTDGLFWASDMSSKPSPISSFVAEACTEGYKLKGGKGPAPFHGYYFKILTCQGPAAAGGKMDYVKHGDMTGGFALVAYPVRWGESGVMTFIVNQDGVVYQRSLGEKTARLAAGMKEYNPDTNWTVVDEPGLDFNEEQSISNHK